MPVAQQPQSAVLGAAVDLATWAAAHVPLWRDLVGQKPVTADAWHELPVVDREILTRRFADSLAPGLSATAIVDAAGPESGRFSASDCEVFTSAGAKGNLVRFVWDERTWNHFLDACRGRIPPAIRRGARIALVGTNDPKHTLTRMRAAWPTHAVCVVGLQDGVRAACDRLEDFAPHVLLGISSCLVMLANAQAEERLHLAPKCVLAGTDSLTVAGRRLLQEVWRVPVTTAYTTTEGGLVATECAHGNLHIDTAAVYLEEEHGDLLLTNMLNRSQPIIRMRIADDAQLSPHHCKCGVDLPVITLAAGRENEPLRVPGIDEEWTLLHPIVWRSALDDLGLKRVPTVSQCEGITVVSTEPPMGRVVEERLVRAWVRAGADPRALCVTEDAGEAA